MKVLASGIKCLIILFAALTFATDGIAKTLEILAFPYPPFLITAETGILPRIIGEAAQEAGLKIKLIVRPRKRAIQMFETDEFQFFLGENRYFPEQLSKLDVQKLIYARIVIAYLKSKYASFDFNNNKAVRGKTFGVSLGSNLIPVFKKRGWSVETVRELEYNIKKLEAGRIDFWGTVDLSAISLIKKYFPERQNEFSMWEMEKFSIELVSKKNSPLEPSFLKLQAGFKKSVQNGTYKKILEDYYGKGKVPLSVMAE